MSPFPPIPPRPCMFPPSEGGEVTEGGKPAEKADGAEIREVRGRICGIRGGFGELFVREHGEKISCR